MVKTQAGADSLLRKVIRCINPNSGMGKEFLFSPKQWFTNTSPFPAMLCVSPESGLHGGPLPSEHESARQPHKTADFPHQGKITVLELIKKHISAQPASTVSRCRSGKGVAHLPQQSTVILGKCHGSVLKAGKSMCHLVLSISHC